MDVSPGSTRLAILGLKKTIARVWGWSLFDIDETDLCNLLDFIQTKPDDDPNTRIIKGKVYRRARGVPKWL